jgi:2-polyprenyl-3-methyl-5-hydroxy-6-metoxy-1,4-benzoquinol methylase
MKKIPMGNNFHHEKLSIFLLFYKVVRYLSYSIDDQVHIQFWQAHVQLWIIHLKLVEKMSRSHYVASVGNDDKERLSIQHDSFSKGTEEFLKEIDIREGMNILVVGCGGGDETVTIAKKVGASGRVTAIDISPEQIKIAQEKIYE